MFAYRNLGYFQFYVHNFSLKFYILDASYGTSK